MEFDRRTQKGKAAAAAAAAAVSQREQDRKTSQEVAQSSSSPQAHPKDEQRPTAADELREAQRFSEAMHTAHSSSGTSIPHDPDRTASDSSGRPPPPPSPPLHNLSKASEYVQQGDELSAAFVPLRLAAIRIEGAKNVRPSFLSRLCRPYVDVGLRPTVLNRLIYAHRLDQVMPGQPANLPSLLSLLSSLGADVAGLDVFADVTATLQPSLSSVTEAMTEDSSSGHAFTTPASTEDVDVVLTCKDRPRFFLKSSTDVGNGEGNASVQARIRNVFGGAEMADLSATMGTRTRRAFHGALSWPVFGLSDHMMGLSAYAQDRDLTGFASATEGARGARLSLRWNDVSGPSRGIHELAYDLAHRHLARIQPSASLGIRHLAGHSVKSSVSHTFTRDTRDDTSMATTGSLCKTLIEYAGLGGDAQHVKMDMQTQLSRCFGLYDARGREPDLFSISLAARMGALATLNGRPSGFSDRFQLGGPTSVRMFRHNSIGPKDGLDSLGGDAYYSIGTSIIAPLWPGKAHWPLKWHAFVNAGQLIQLDHTRSHKDGPMTLLQRNGALVCNEMLFKPSSSAGVGIMLRQGGLRAEINVGVPLTMRKGDGARKGIQLGIGIDFL